MNPINLSSTAVVPPAPPSVYISHVKTYNPATFTKQKGKKVSTLLDASQIGAFGLTFIGGLLVNANSYWKTLGHESFLPWYYESTWIGWQNWPNLIVNPLFWVAIVIALCVTLLKAITAVLISLEAYDSISHYLDIPVAKYSDLTNVIDYTPMYSKFKYNDFKTYKTSEKSTRLGLVLMVTRILEIVILFTQNNPYRFINPAQFLGCVLFVLAANFFPTMILKVIIDRFLHE